jgi:hypothetical protein
MTARSAAASRTTSNPATLADPESGESRVVRIRTMVDLVTALTGPNARRRPSVTIASLTRPPMIWRCHG